MRLELTITDLHEEEFLVLSKCITALLSASEVRSEAKPESISDENVGIGNGESTREKGLVKFFTWAQSKGLRIRRSQAGEHGTFTVTVGRKQWPVEVICSKRPRLSLRKQWSEPEDLLLAYVWVEDEKVVMLRYSEVEAMLENAAFTPDGFYTKALSQNRAQALLRYQDRLEFFEESAVETLMETGRFANVHEARDYYRENGLPGIAND